MLSDRQRAVNAAVSVAELCRDRARIQRELVAGYETRQRERLERLDAPPLYVPKLTWDPAQALAQALKDRADKIAQRVAL